MGVEQVGVDTAEAEQAAGEVTTIVRRDAVRQSYRLGFAVGAASGAAAGTVVYPLIGTLLGAAFGLVVAILPTIAAGRILFLQLADPHPDETEYRAAVDHMTRVIAVAISGLALFGIVGIQRWGPQHASVFRLSLFAGIASALVGVVVARVRLLRVGGRSIAHRPTLLLVGLAGACLARL